MIAQWLKSNWFWIALLLAFILGLVPFEYQRYRNRGRRVPNPNTSRCW